MVTVIPEHMTIVDGGTLESLMVTDPAMPGREDGGAKRGKAHVPDILASLSRLSSRNVRVRPPYTNCWVLGCGDDMHITESYALENGSVTVGTTSDGEMEYRIVPEEYDYTESTQSAVTRFIDDVRDHFLRTDEAVTRNNILSKASDLVVRSGLLDSMDGPEEAERFISSVSRTVYRHTMGLGIFDTLLSDGRIEDVYIDAPCHRNRIYITMNGPSSQYRCRTNLLADPREIDNLISSLKRESGLSFGESSPVLETDIGEHDCRVTVVGYPMSPEGNAVAIRKHSAEPWTLTRMISNGTMDGLTAGLLSFLVDMRSTILICGARGSGKSSLLSAMMFEFPVSQRILTIEDTMELPCEKMRRMGYKVQSILTDDRMDTDSLRRSDDALRTSMRMGESAMVIGEVRGSEAGTLYQSMRAGRAGSSVMGTIHGDSADSVYKRVVFDLGVSKESFGATEVIVTMGSPGDGGIRTVTEISALAGTPGTFVPLISSGRLSEECFGTPLFKRILSRMDRGSVESEIARRAEIKGFLSDMSLRDREFGGAEWTAMSNGFMRRPGTAEDFKEWFGRYNGIEL